MKNIKKKFTSINALSSSSLMTSSDLQISTLKPVSIFIEQVHAIVFLLLTAHALEFGIL
jgi:hypothetical protein